MGIRRASAGDASMIGIEGTVVSIGIAQGIPSVVRGSTEAGTSIFQYIATMSSARYWHLPIILERNLKLLHASEVVLLLYTTI